MSASLIFKKRPEQVVAMLLRSSNFKWRSLLLLHATLLALFGISVFGSAENVRSTVVGSKAIALDIDGVLYRSGHLFSRTTEAMKLLESSKIPFVFVTNGGGLTETEKSDELTHKIGITVRPEQIIMAHTPFSKIAEEHKDQRVLIIGHEGCLKVARSYGFSKVASVRDIHEENPSIYPHRNPINLPSCAERGQPIEAILIFHDCLDWGLEMQIIFDIIVGRQHQPKADSSILESFKQIVPIYQSNADIVYASNHPFPRFTQGAFIEAFRSLFELYASGEKLFVNTCGKPFKVQYDFATDLLEKQAALIGQPAISRFYGVGDNPKSDIRGANNAGDKWRSVLVRTGVFTGTDNDEEDPADVVVEDILDAINYILADP
jgi:HAD superfamily hydrolase (TIGR01456 family)